MRWRKHLRQAEWFCGRGGRRRQVSSPVCRSWILSPMHKVPGSCELRLTEAVAASTADCVLRNERFPVSFCSRNLATRSCTDRNSTVLSLQLKPGCQRGLRGVMKQVRLCTRHGTHHPPQATTCPPTLILVPPLPQTTRAEVLCCRSEQQGLGLELAVETRGAMRGDWDWADLVEGSILAPVPNFHPRGVRVPCHLAWSALVGTSSPAELMCLIQTPTCKHWFLLLVEFSAQTTLRSQTT